MITIRQSSLARLESCLPSIVVATSTVWLLVGSCNISLLSIDRSEGAIIVDDRRGGMVAQESVLQCVPQPL